MKIIPYPNDGCTMYQKSPEGLHVAERMDGLWEVCTKTNDEFVCVEVHCVEMHKWVAVFKGWFRLLFGALRYCAIVCPKKKVWDKDCF